MKKNKTKNLVVWAVLLTILTLILVSGTYAKYTSSFTGDGTATVAKWSLKANGSENATLEEVALVDTTLNTKVADGRIAPGTDGGLSVELDATGSEVAIDYTVEISNIENKPTNLKFYSDAAFTTELTETAVGSGIYATTGTIALADVATPVNVPLYWKWDYETTGGDPTDTTEGKAAASMTFDVVVTGTQQDPRTPLVP